MTPLVATSDCRTRGELQLLLRRLAQVCAVYSPENRVNACYGDLDEVADATDAIACSWEGYFLSYKICGFEG